VVPQWRMSPKLLHVRLTTSVWVSAERSRLTWASATSWADSRWSGNPRRCQTRTGRRELQSWTWYAAAQQASAAGAAHLDQFLNWISHKLSITDDERRCGGSAFQTAGAATWKLCRPSCVLVKGTNMSWRSAERIWPTRNADDWDADVVEVGRTVLTDTVKRRDAEIISLMTTVCK